MPWPIALHPSSIGRIFKRIKKQQIDNYFAEIAGKRRKLFEALGVPVPDAEPEREMDYEDEPEEVETL